MEIVFTAHPWSSTNTFKQGYTMLAHMKKKQQVNRTWVLGVANHKKSRILRSQTKCS